VHNLADDATDNFAGRLAARLGPNSRLIDAATGHTVDPDALRPLIAGTAAALLAAGLRRGDRILIGSSLSPSSAVIYLAAIYAGLVAVPMDERTLRASAPDLVHATGAKAVWSEAGLKWSGLDNTSVFSLQGDLAGKAEGDLPPAGCTADELAVLMATSGSTGTPRFVMVSHGNLIANTEAIIQSQRLGDGERAMVILPLSYCFGASLLHTHLYAGGSVVFDRRFMFPDKVLHAMAELHCTTFAGVPTVYDVLLHRSNIRSMPFPHLKRFLQAGGALSREKINEMRTVFPDVDFYVMYGQTEATARISCLEPKHWNEKLGSVGRPLHNLTVVIADAGGKALGAGQIGEVLVKGPSICTGYLNDPEETRQVFRDGWLHTGDLARQDDEGYLWIEGRKGTFLKIRGTRVSFAEVEGRVAAMPGVYECGACAVAHPESGDALMLMVVPDQKSPVDIEQIRRSLPAHWTVDSIRLVSALPKTSTGKLARPALREWATSGHAAIS
jgi:acyl-CoA synthetase (AMP-forming)/AMP-acid ligase II